MTGAEQGGSGSALWVRVWNDPVAGMRLGVELLGRRRVADAERLFERVAALVPTLAEAQVGLAACALETGDWERAAARCRRAIALDSACVAAHRLSGNALTALGLFEAAEASYRRALDLIPGQAEAWNGLGVLAQRRGRTDEAVRHYRRALEIEPGHARAHYHLALALLRLGAFREGWREHEWRWAAGAAVRPAGVAALPDWSGGSADGRRLILFGEQGLGDTIQFLRFAPRVAALGARVIVAVPSSLARLASGLAGVAAVVAQDAPFPAADARLALMSAPLALGLARPDEVAAAPYLAPDPGSVAVWRERLSGLPGLRVGLVWAGNPRAHDPEARLTDSRRSLPLARFAALAALPGLSLVSLQAGTAADQRREAAFPVFDPMGDVTDFSDTAGLIANLDLVIGVDTAVVHLAGAMGRPVWILSRFDGCWRWMEGRDDTPWYATARLYRQSMPDDWDSVLGLLARDLHPLTETPVRGSALRMPGTLI